MNAPEPLDQQRYLDQIVSDADRVAELATAGPLDASVAACPGWDLRQLVVHLGGVHRWARYAVTEGRAPDVVPDMPSDDDARTATGEWLAEWLTDGARALAESLAATPPDTPVWHPFGGPQAASIWPRRQAHETMVHRRDAELAVGSLTPMPPAMASDGIDEFFEVMVPRFIARGVLERLPTGSLHVHCTDVAGEWLVWDDDGALGMRREHAKGDAALRGPAEALLGRLWGRSTPATDGVDEVDVVGDVDVARAWSTVAR